MGLLRSDLPTIIVGETEHHDLVVLAMSGVGHTADAADDLLFELERAMVLDDWSLPREIIRMGSSVLYDLDKAGPRREILSYPDEMDDTRGRISILTPVGTALLGLSPGQTMKWTCRDGARHELLVLAVEKPRL